MKKFLLVVTLVGVVVSYIFFSSTADAYKNPSVYEYGAKQGAVLRVETKKCVSHSGYGAHDGCGAICRRATINGALWIDESDKFSDIHMFEAIAYNEYVYDNGQWVER